MTKPDWIAEYRKINPEVGLMEATEAYYRAHPVEKIKEDPFLFWLWIKLEDLDKRIKQLEDK